MEAGKTQDLLCESASWRPRGVNGLVSNWTWRPENQESWCWSFILKADRPETQEELMFHFQSKDREKPMFYFEGL